MTDNHNDETIQPTDLKRVTQAELQNGLERTEQRIKAHIDTRLRELHDENKTRGDKFDMRIVTLENKRHESQQMHTALNGRLDVVLTRLEQLRDLQVRFNDLTKRVNVMDTDIDTARTHIADIEQRGALTVEAVKRIETLAVETRNELRGISAQVNAQAKAHKHSIDALSQSVIPQIQWIEQRRGFEKTAIDFLSSKFGMVIITVIATILLGNNGLQLIELIFGGN